MMLVLAWMGAARADEVTIGSKTTTIYTLPFNTSERYSLSQQIYTADEIGMAGTIGLYVIVAAFIYFLEE